jgi:Glycosyl hydrolase family 9
VLVVRTGHLWPLQPSHVQLTARPRAAQVNTAHRLFRSAVFSPGLYLDALNGTDTGLGALYPSSDLGDDLFWAASWLFRAGVAGIRAYNLTYYTEAVKITMELAFNYLDAPGVDVNYVNNLALVHVATQTQDTQYHLPAQSFIYDWICDDEQIKYTRNGRAYYFESPYLGNTAAAAAMAALYVKANAGWDFVAQNKGLVKGARRGAGLHAAAHRQRSCSMRWTCFV